MNHGCCHKNEIVAASGKRIALFDHNAARSEIVSKKVLHHRERLSARDDLSLRIARCELGYICRVIRLHVMNHEIVHICAIVCLFNVLEPLVAEITVYGVENSALFILDEIGVVSHSAGNSVLPLEKIDLMVVYADILDII